MADDLTCRTFDDRGASLCEELATHIVWGHLYEKRDKGPKCVRHLPKMTHEPWVGLGRAIYEITPVQPDPLRAEWIDAAADRLFDVVAHRVLWRAQFREAFHAALAEAEATRG